MWGINWRTGFFRLWIIASVLWAIFVLIVSWRTIEAGIGGAEPHGLSYYGSYSMKGQPSDYLPLDPTPPTLGSLMDQAQWLIDNSSKAGTDDYRKVLEAYERADLIYSTPPAKDYFWIMAALIVPPLILLAFGAALGWALSGFRPARRA